MLSEFIAANQDEIVARSRARVAGRSAPRPTDDELARGIPLFVNQLVEVLRGRRSGSSSTGATSHGADLHRMDFTVAQVVHDYGDVCQAVTQLAIEQGAPITPMEFQVLNKNLDDAIAGAVTEFARLGEGSREHAEAERLGFLAHEMRNKINAAMLSFNILKGGRIGLGGSTGAVLERNLKGLHDLISRSLADVRVAAGVQHRERVDVRTLVEELEAEGSMAANDHRIHFSVAEVEPDMAVDADRALLAGALMNLLTNAFKFTRPGSHVWLRTTGGKDRISFAVEDECGGLEVSDPRVLFDVWTRKSADKQGLGLGLPLVKRTVEALGGTVDVTNRPGKGCIFTVQLPRASAAG